MKFSFFLKHVIKNIFLFSELERSIKKETKRGTLHESFNEPKREFCTSTNDVRGVFPPSQLFKSSRRKFFPLEGTLPLCVFFIFRHRGFCRLHQRAGLALSRHHDRDSSHARQRGGADLWRHSEWRWNLRLSPISPFGNGDHGAPEKLRRGPVGSGRPLVFTSGRASDVVAGETL